MLRTVTWEFRCLLQAPPAPELLLSPFVVHCTLVFFLAQPLTSLRRYRLLSILWLTAPLLIWLHTSHVLPRKCGKVCGENAISVHGMGVQEKALYGSFLFPVIGNPGPGVVGFLISINLCCYGSNRSQNMQEQSSSPGGFFSGWQWSFSADASAQEVSVNSQACFIALLPFYSFRGWEAVRTQTAFESVTRA